MQELLQPLDGAHLLHQLDILERVFSNAQVLNRSKRVCQRQRVFRKDVRYDRFKCLVSFQDGPRLLCKSIHAV